MKKRQVIEIVTETYEEEQFIVSRFPEAWWECKGDNIVFILPLNLELEVMEALEEFEYLKKEADVK